MSKAKLYKVKLVQGFNAKGRQRAGIVLQKNTTIITELNKEQLKALNDDVWIEVSEAPKGSEPTAPGDNFSDAVVAPEDETAEVNEDQAEATAEAEIQAEDDAAEEEGDDLPEAGDLSDEEKADVNEDQAEATAEAEDQAAEDAQEEQADEAGEDSEEVEISADMKRPELEKIAKEVGIENPSDQSLYPNKPTLVKAIQEASASTEE